MNTNLVFIYGDGKFMRDRHDYTDGEENFRGTKEEAYTYFVSKYPSKSIMICFFPRGHRGNRYYESNFKTNQ
jgi:hypothetical protein